MRAAGTSRARAYAEPTSQLGLPSSRECCSLLMAHTDPLYFAAANRVGERIEGIADKPEDVPDPDLFQHSDQDVCYRLDHLRLLRCCDGIRRKS